MADIRPLPQKWLPGHFETVPLSTTPYRMYWHLNYQAFNLHLMSEYLKEHVLTGIYFQTMYIRTSMISGPNRLDKPIV
jgi:hypothetical protein